MKIPRGALFSRVTQNHKQKGPLGQVLLEFGALKKENPRGPTHLRPKSLKIPRETPEKRAPQWWRRRQSGWVKPVETLLPGKVHWALQSKLPPTQGKHIPVGRSSMLRQGKCGR